MARIPYADISDPQIEPLVDRIVAERGSVLHLYQMLLHSPPVAEGWLSLLTAVRQQSELRGAIRELVIVRVAQLNGASYEAEQHTPIALSLGITQAQLTALGDWRNSDSFTADQRAALALTDAMTRYVQVDDTDFEEARVLFGVRELTELVTTVAAYNMVSRFLEAMHIHSSRDP